MAVNIGMGGSVSVSCPGPLVWFDVEPDATRSRAAVLECATCGYVVTTGNLHDDAHGETPLMREGMANA